MARAHIPKPQTDEYAPYYSRYIELVPGDDALPALRSQIEVTLRLLSGLSDAAALHRYESGKWTIKQVVGHLCDAERVFSYRAVRIARGDQTPLPGFDEKSFAEHGDFDARMIAGLCQEFGAVRAATLALFGSLGAEALARRGTASNAAVSTRALAWMIAGHELHHVKILRERYRIGGGQ